MRYVAALILSLAMVGCGGGIPIDQSCSISLLSPQLQDQGAVFRCESQASDSHFAIWNSFSIPGHTGYVTVSTDTAIKIDAPLDPSRGEVNVEFGDGFSAYCGSTAGTVTVHKDEGEWSVDLDLRCLYELTPAMSIIGSLRSPMR